MPSYKIVVNPVDVIYTYDGSLAGFLCCVHESFYARELPINVVSIEHQQPSLYADRFIKTDETKARSVRGSIEKNISKRGLQLIDHVFLCHHENRELKLLKFLIMAFRNGPRTLSMHGDPVVAEVLAMERHMLGERHLLSGFIRFKDYGNILGAVISPKNFVLPLLAEHFIDRFPNENFMIYDKTYNATLIYQDKKLELTAVEEVKFADESEEEIHYQNLWKHFYKTIGIKERINPKCRMRNMPKRYWVNMLEVQDEL